MDIEIVYSARKTLALEVTPGLTVLARAPFGCKRSEIEAFAAAHQAWLERALSRQRERARRFDLTDEQRSELRQRAARVLPERVAYFARLTGLHPTGLKITAAKTRFGSCSAKNSICLSFYLCGYPEAAIDYVVLHELAHIRYKNHGKAFYAFIARYMPDYKERIRLLR